MPTAAIALLPSASGMMMGAGAASAFGQVMTGVQNMRAGEMQSKALQYQAQEQRVATASEITSANARANSLMATARVSAAAGGVSQGGSAAVINAGNFTQARLNEARIRYSGELASTAALYEAANARWQGKQALFAGLIGAGGSLLTSAYQAETGKPLYTGSP